VTFLKLTAEIGADKEFEEDVRELLNNFKESLKFYLYKSDMHIYLLALKDHVKGRARFVIDLFRGGCGTRRTLTDIRAILHPKVFGSLYKIAYLTILGKVDIGNASQILAVLRDSAAHPSLHSFETLAKIHIDEVGYNA
jgi:hypothetical protein